MVRTSSPVGYNSGATGLGGAFAMLCSVLARPAFPIPHAGVSPGGPLLWRHVIKTIEEQL